MRNKRKQRLREKRGNGWARRRGRGLAGRRPRGRRTGAVPEGLRDTLSSGRCGQKSKRSALKFSWEELFFISSFNNPGSHPACCLVTSAVESKLSVKVAQSCPSLYDPMDCSPPGSPVHGDSPGKNTGVACHALLQGIFPTQVSRIAGGFFTYRLSHQGRP